MTALDASEKQEALEKVYQSAYDYERTAGCCPQCVLAAIQDVLGMGGDEIFKAAHPLAGGGGLALKGTCGALAGAMLAVGSVYGRRSSRLCCRPLHGLLRPSGASLQGIRRRIRQSYMRRRADAHHGPLLRPVGSQGL